VTWCLMIWKMDDMWESVVDSVADSVCALVRDSVTDSLRDLVLVDLKQQTGE
jgi:hypothetical protein